MKRSLLFIFLPTMALSSSWADLKFDSKRISYEAKPDEEQFEAVFEFKNTGKHPIDIKKVDSNCGCLSAKTDKERYAKGESGKVTAIFKIGSAEGVQTKSVSLMYAEDLPVVKPKVVQPAETPNTSDPLAFRETPPPPPEPVKPIVAPTQTDRLTVELTIPSLVQITPKITKWDVGSPPETKTVEVVVDHDEPIKILGVRCSRSNVSVETKEVEPGKRYELALTPESTDKIQLGMLTIETDSSIKKHRKKLAFFSIQRPLPETAAPVVVDPAPADEAEATDNEAKKPATAQTADEQ